MKVLIAGCGYVGCALATELRDAGHEVFGLRRNITLLPEGTTGIAADLSDPSSLERALAHHPFDWVVYAAAATARSEQAYRSAYVEGLRHVLAAVATPQRLLFTSSTAVYGQTEGEAVDETSPTNPNHFSGQIMLEAEQLVRDAACPSVVLRLGGIYGPTRTRLIDQVREGRAQLPTGPQFTNRIHRDDCAGAIAHLLQLPSPDLIYLGVDDDPADMADVLSWLADQLGVERPPPATGAPPKRGKRCSNARLRASNYALRHSTFREGYAQVLIG